MITSRPLYSRPADGPVVTLAFAGDLALSGAVPENALVRAPTILAGCDLVFANYEGVLCDDPNPPGRFAAPSARADALAAAGFTHLGVANNHSCDHGARGLGDTVSALARAGITAVGLDGADPLVVCGCQGLRIGVLAAARTRQEQLGAPRFCELDPAALLTHLHAARARVDVLVVSLHLGFMYVDFPSPEHRELTHQLVAAGADLVVCHHAHVLQGVEVLGSSLIAHNLGNLLVDPDEGVLANTVLPERQREGALLVAQVDRRGLVHAHLTPTTLDDDLRLALPEPEQAAAILARVEAISRRLGEPGWEREFADQRAERNTDLGLAEVAALVQSGRLRDLISMLRRARLEHLVMVWRRLVGGRP